MRVLSNVAEDLSEYDRYVLRVTRTRYYKICETCGERFRAARSDKKTCSTNCRKRLSRAKCDMGRNGKLADFRDVTLSGPR